MANKIVARKPALGSRWISKNGNHKGLEIVVTKVSQTTVVVEPIGNHHKANKIRGKPYKWRLPLDAFYRRYEQ
jgi:hypothetical protein